MKRLLALILTILMCLSFTACKDGTTQKNATHLTETELEQEIRVLIEQNLDCYFLFYVSPLPHTTQQNSDGYYGTDGSYFENFDALKNLLKSTYISSKVEELLVYPSADTPLYKDVEGYIFTKPDVIKPVKYNLSWEDYTVEFSEISDEKCTFTLKTTDFDGKKYETNGSASLENGKWLLENIVH